MAAGGILYLLFGQRLITSMYEGASTGFLNRIIERQAIHSLEYYLQKADFYFIFFFILFGLTGLFIILLLRKQYSIAIFITFVILLAGSVLHIFAGYSHNDLSGHAWGSDDAYVSYRYAKNLIQGHGLVFNPGERVEGYSNFLYTLLMALGLIITGGRNIYAFSSIMNICFAALAFSIFYRYIKKSFGKDKAALAMFLFGCCPSIWVWVSSGLETPLILLIQIALWINLDRIVNGRESSNLLQLSILMILSILTRVDGFILPAIAVIYLLLRNRKRAALYCLISAAITITIYFFWRYNYYGYFLSNSYYAKVSGPLLARCIDGIEKLKIIALQQGLLLYLLLFLFSLLCTFLPRTPSHIPFSTFFAGCWLLYWTYIGGDVFQERFLLVLFPLGIFSLFKLTAQKRKALLCLAVIIAILQLRPILIYPYGDIRFNYSLSKYDRWIVLGKFLGEKYPDKILAIDAAGKVCYFSDLVTIDMLGINDEFIAHKKVDFFSAGHNKFDSDYILSKKPDLIACWIHPDMNCSWDLEREKYEKAGYFLRYLVNSKKDSTGNDIIDVNGYDESEIIQLIYNSYSYAVLQRK
jgi:hypothetical protein